MSGDEHESDTDKREDSLTTAFASDAGDRVESDRFRIGQDLGKYQLKRKLGAGGMGEVWLAFDRTFQMDVALKFPRQDFQDLLQLRSEAQTLAKLFHPTLCRIFDVSAADGQWYIAMAYVPGGPLIYDKERDLATSLDLVRTVALGLHEAHLSGIIHRDIKPSNILLDEMNRPVVLDFGLAVSKAAMADTAGLMAGTPSYMPPEQAIGDPALIGPHSDEFSLGLLLHEILTGEKPRKVYSDSDERPEFRFCILPPSHLNPDIPPDVDQVCGRMMNARPERRFGAMDRVGAAIEPLLRVADPTPEPVRRESIQLQFMGQNHIAPQNARHQDQLYLDVGNQLRDGIVDHHHISDRPTCSAELVFENPGLVAAAVKPWRNAADPFTIITHKSPDLDGVVATYLALLQLQRRSFTPQLASLVEYVSAVDQGLPGIDLAWPFSIYAAYQQRCHSLLQRKWDMPDDAWRQMILDGLQITRFVVRELEQGRAVRDVDAFNTPGLFRQWDRDEVVQDAQRYQEYLEDPATCARHQDVLIEKSSVPFLFLRQTATSQPPMFLKDWARSDRQRCPQTSGYVGLCVYSNRSQACVDVHSAGEAEAGSIADRSTQRSTPVSGDVGESQAGRAIISVRPKDAVQLVGLGAALESAEVKKRMVIFGRDDRATDPRTREPIAARPGYHSPDPWYDGRAHRYTIVDAPHQGTRLSADEIEAIVTAFFES